VKKERKEKTTEYPDREKRNNDRVYVTRSNSKPSIFSRV
jgi:hypothetical protein